MENTEIQFWKIWNIGTVERFVRVAPDWNTGKHVFPTLTTHQGTLETGNCYKIPIAGIRPDSMVSK